MGKRILFDTDIGSDVDDAVALGLILGCADELELVGVTTVAGGTRLRAEIAAIKLANLSRPDTHDYNEAETRDAFIDLLLREAGWPLDQPRDREFPVSGMPAGTGQGYADYVLWGGDGKPLAVVEAKRTKREAAAGRPRAAAGR